MMPWYGGGMPGWAMLFMMVATLVLLALLVVGAIALGRYLSRPPQSAASTPEELLAQRLALGEIDEEDYRRRAALLSGPAVRRPT